MDIFPREPAVSIIFWYQKNTEKPVPAEHCSIATWNGVERTE